jgi:hypothetical protein
MITVSHTALIAEGANVRLIAEGENVRLLNG